MADWEAQAAAAAAATEAPPPSVTTVADAAAAAPESASPAPAPAPARKPLGLSAVAKEFKFGAGAAEFVPSFAPPAPAPAEAAPVDAVVDALAALSIAPTAVPAPTVEPVVAAPAPEPAPPATVVPPAVPAGGGASSAAAAAASPGGAAAGEGDDFADTFDEFGGAPASAKAVPAEGDPREHLNTVFIGHVDAGKSTLSGSILFHTGQVDARAIEKFEREAKAKNRDSWFLAFIMDTNDEERTKGITVEVGRATFETANKRFTILDAPGHKNYVPNMIAGAAQADIAVLVISARKGEFETGFERGGQTREHAMLAKTLGVRQLFVVVNKMDEPTVKWSKARYDEIVTKLTPFLKSAGYNVTKGVTFLPISGLSGANVKDRTPAGICPWYSGPSLLELLDAISVTGRDADAPLRVPVLDRYADRGLIVMGKVEAGTVREGQKVLLQPGRVEAIVDTLYINDAEVRLARPGENIKLKLRGCREEDVCRGFMICDMERFAIPVRQFEAQIMLLELEAHSLFTAGYACILHVHTAQEDVVVKRLVSELDKKTGEPKPGGAPKFIKSQGLCTAILEVSQAVCVEKFDALPQLGRFTLRDGTRTIAIGKVLRLGIPKADQAAYLKATGGGGGAAGGGASSGAKAK